jgi:hypothetical protein
LVIAKAAAIVAIRKAELLDDPGYCMKNLLRKGAPSLLSGLFLMAVHLPVLGSTVRGVYVGDDFYEPLTKSATAKASGFNTLFLFAATPSLTYRIQRATNINGPWNTAGNVSALFNSCEFNDTNPPAGPASYRSVTP